MGTVDTCGKIVKEVLGVFGKIPAEIRDLKDHKEIIVSILTDLEAEVNNHTKTDEQVHKSAYPGLLAIVACLGDRGVSRSDMKKLVTHVKDKKDKIEASIKQYEELYEKHVVEVQNILKEKQKLCDEHGKQA